MVKPLKKAKGSEAAKTAAKKFTSINVRYFDSHNAPEADRETLREILGDGNVTDYLRASDVFLRCKASKILGQELESLRASNPKLHFNFWTCVSERGDTSDREPVIDIKFMRELTYKMLHKLNLDGIIVAEVQGVGNYPAKGKGRLLMTHTHAITWSEHPVRQATVDQATHHHTWNTTFGAKPVVVKPIAEAEGELDYLAYYLWKCPYDVKMVEGRWNGERLVSREKSYSPEFAVRLLELNSQLELPELVSSIGDGKAIRQNLVRRLTHTQKARPGWREGKPKDMYYKEFWDKYRMKKKKKQYLPFKIKK